MFSAHRCVSFVFAETTSLLFAGEARTYPTSLTLPLYEIYWGSFGGGGINNFSMVSMLDREGS